MKSPLTALTDTELVEQVPTDGPEDRIWNQAPFLLEMQRRQIEAVKALNRSSTVLAIVTIVLTVAILGLTAVMVWKGA
jgi:hypothetical protein